MCPRQSLRDLNADCDGVLDWQRTLADPAAQRRAFDELHGNEDHAIRLADLVDGCDVWMGNGGGGTRLAQKPGTPIFVGDDVRGENLQRNRTPQVLVLGPEDHTHPALADFGEDSEVGKGPSFHRLPTDAG